MRSPHDRVFSLLQGFFEPPREFDCTAVGIFKGLGSTRFEAVMPVFSGKCDPRASFLPREADLVAHKVVRMPRASVISFPRGLPEPPSDSD